MAAKHILSMKNLMAKMSWCPHQESNLKFILTMDMLCHLTIGANLLFY